MNIANGYEIRPQSNPETGFRGVSLYRTGRWRARIYHQGHQLELGYFADEGDAARAYDARARQLYGASAQLNFPREGEQQGKALQRQNMQSKATGATAMVTQQGQRQGTSTDCSVSTFNYWMCL